MKNKLSKNFFALLLTLAFIFSLTACTPEIHIHTGDASNSSASSENAIASDPDTTTDSLIASTEENTAIASSDEKTEDNNASKDDIQTSIASSEKEKTESKKEGSTATKDTSSKTTASKPSATAKISQEKAKSIALKHANINEADISRYKIKLDRDDNTPYYDISFEVDNKSYKYGIHAETGNILSYQKPKTSGSSTSSKKPSGSSTSSDKTSKPSSDSKKTSGSAQITSSKAKSLALKDAGVKEADIYDFEIELDNDRGVLKYDISFEVDGKDYDYEINAETGKFISIDKPKATSNEAKISKEKAKSTALKHAGVKEGDTSRYKSELEKDDGIWKYEISFNVGNVEYDYTINAENGKILGSEKDIDD